MTRLASGKHLRAASPGAGARARRRPASERQGPGRHQPAPHGTDGAPHDLGAEADVEDMTMPAVSGSSRTPSTGSAKVGPEEWGTQVPRNDVDLAAKSTGRLLAVRAASPRTSDGPGRGRAACAVSVTSAPRQQRQDADDQAERMRPVPATLPGTWARRCGRAGTRCRLLHGPVRDQPSERPVEGVPAGRPRPWRRAAAAQTIGSVAAGFGQPSTRSKLALPRPENRIVSPPQSRTTSTRRAVVVSGCPPGPRVLRSTRASSVRGAGDGG